MRILYFAYGSCMSPEELGRDVPSYTVIGPALVRGFRIGFTRFSRNWKGGVADLVPDIDSRVEGVLYRLPFASLSALDEREGAPDHYRRDFIAVRTSDGKIHDRVLTYVVTRKATVNIPPHADYANTVLAGAEAYLSSQYVKEVRTLVEHLAAQQRERKEAKERIAWRERRLSRSSGFNRRAGSNRNR